jgi:hypothetical protein
LERDGRFDAGVGELSARGRASGGAPPAASRWPNALIIGAHKAGTTSLHNYLAAHPEVQMSEHKELSYFVGPTEDPRLVSRWNRGPEWYRAQFAGPEPVHGESSTTYANLPQMPGVARRIRETIPEAKLIYAVRDPRRRLVSHYLHMRGLGRERRTLAEILTATDLCDSAYLARSRYWYQLSDYLGYFAPSQILVVSLEDMGADRTGTMRRVFEFLDVDPSFASPDWDTVHNASHRYPLLEALGKIADEPTVYDLTNNRRGLRRILMGIKRPQSTVPDLDDATWSVAREILAAEASELRNFTGQLFPGWSV